MNLFGVQPVEAIRLLVVFALAAYFARRLELLRELSEPPTAARPWLRLVRVPRWKDVRPVVVSMALVLAFFFLQKDLGPALVLSCVVMALYAIARGRVAFVFVGFAMLLAGFALAYWIGQPATVGQRVAIWLDPWNNGVAGGNQIAHGLWALSTGSIWGSRARARQPAVDPGRPHRLRAGRGRRGARLRRRRRGRRRSTRCSAGAACASRRAHRATTRRFSPPAWRWRSSSRRSSSAAACSALFPLAGVVTPFLSFGRSSMLANCFAVGVVLAVARRRGPVRAAAPSPDPHARRGAGRAHGGGARAGGLGAGRQGRRPSRPRRA